MTRGLADAHAWGIARVLVISFVRGGGEILPQASERKGEIVVVS